MLLRKIRDIITDSKRRNRIIIGLVLSFFIVMILFSDYGLIKRLSLSIKEMDYNSKIEEQKQLNDSLKTRIDNLQNDTTLIEKIAREKYGMIKKGETIILIEK